MEKFLKIIPVGRQDYAYQGENVSTRCSIMAHVPTKSGSLPYLNDEQDKYKDYELVIEKFTSNSILVTLKKHRIDTVEQRKLNGKAIKVDSYQFTTTFAQLVNSIFSNIEVNHYTEEEHFPKDVEKLMMTVYNDKK